MKILFAANEYVERGKPATGFPNYLYRVSKALVKSGHRPVIICAGRRNSHRVEEGIEVWTVATEYRDYKNQCMNKIFNALALGGKVNKKIKEYLEKESVDIIQFTSLGGLALFYHGTVPAVMRLSSYAKTYFSSFQTLQPQTVRAMSLLERMSAKRCRAVFAPCKNTAEAFGRDCHRKVSVIETPFENDVNTYDDYYVKTFLEDKPYVLFFGTLYAEKGLLVIAEILNVFLKTNKDYYFVFVGEPTVINGENVRRFLEDAAGNCKERLILWKALPHEQLYPIIKASNFVILPSLMDNFPNACIEAMYFSKIVIGTNGASFEQLIVSGKNGFLCEIGNSADLLEKMRLVVSLEESQREKIEKNAKKRIERLRPELAVKRLIDFYQYVIDRDGKRYGK